MEKKDNIKSILIAAVIVLLLIIIALLAIMLSQSQKQTQLKTQQPLQQSQQQRSSQIQPPPVELKKNIEIIGKQGLSTLNIYLKSNPTEKSKYYSVYRYGYKSEDSLNMAIFSDMSKIEKKCKFLSRTTVDSNSLIYTDWNAFPSETLKRGEKVITQGYRYVYFVAQDDGDFSNPIIFK